VSALTTLPGSPYLGLADPAGGGVRGHGTGGRGEHAAVPYYGGKTGLADRIVAVLPPHRHYVEPFAGSLAVLLAKPRSRLETVNAVNGDLLTFCRCCVTGRGSWREPAR
jgi:hypothetical protein